MLLSNTPKKVSINTCLCSIFSIIKRNFCWILFSSFAFIFVFLFRPQSNSQIYFFVFVALNRYNIVCVLITNDFEICIQLKLCLMSKKMCSNKVKYFWTDLELICKMTSKNRKCFQAAAIYLCFQFHLELIQHISIIQYAMQINRFLKAKNMEKQTKNEENNCSIWHLYSSMCVFHV